MKSLNDLIHRLVQLRRKGRAQLTLLAVCPNSSAVLEAAVKAAAANRAPMLFAATLNQVDLDGGYTGWTPFTFVQEIQRLAQKYKWDGPLAPCLDHGGPWLKDQHTLDQLSLQDSMACLKKSLEACVEAGYQLLHIDPTVDRTLPPGKPVPPQTVVDRTIELIAHAEAIRQARGLPPIAYEVGSEEVHGGLVDAERFDHFLALLKAGLKDHNLEPIWPVFVVAQVGTDLHTTYFDPVAARRVVEALDPLGSLVKGHYSDWVANPQDYPLSGMGGANVGPEFTSEEVLALRDLETKEHSLCCYRPEIEPSGMGASLKRAVVASGRWQKWLLPEEQGLDFEQLRPARQDWLLQTGARYIWTDSGVMEARQKLYNNLGLIMANPNGYVVDRIVRSIDRYINYFNLFDSLSLLR